ncbi:MAG: hypothetical protein E7812_16355 [Phenylobacterium sp.]|nr:MAG: hypothetical protein E7812_16355 [Phenylobacterium sp.]
MTAVRPPIFPPSRPVDALQRADQTKLAAQKAFFDAALGKPAATVAAAQQTAPAAPAVRPQRIPDPTAEAPTKILRPGSLLDIRI